jgi:hypothetical protein
MANRIRLGVIGANALTIHNGRTIDAQRFIVGEIRIA